MSEQDKRERCQAETKAGKPCTYFRPCRYHDGLVEQQIQQHKKDLLTALELTVGVVTTACRTAGLDRGTFYRYLKEDEEFRAAVDELQDVALDFAESALFQQIQAGIPSSTIFYLKTKGKKRGYIERFEQTGPDGGPLEVNSRTIVIKPKAKEPSE